MLGKRSDQFGLFEADHLYLDHVGRSSFYGLLASYRGEIFRDEEFADLYVSGNGRPSVPPSLLATALLLQTYERVSDEEAKERADFDVRWKVALGIEVDQRPFAKCGFRGKAGTDSGARRAGSSTSTTGLGRGRVCSVTSTSSVPRSARASR
jgi:Transposase domain (DUF772)